MGLYRWKHTGLKSAFSNRLEYTPERKTVSAEQNLQQLNLELPPAAKPAGLYKPCLIVDNMCYVSGHGPLKTDKTLITGCIGRDMDVDQGYDAAKQTGLAILATLKQNLGSIDRVKRVVKIFGLVCCTDDFHQQPAVINGCSELFANVFGADVGVGVRSAIGTNALPLQMAVEIEAIFAIEN